MGQMFTEHEASTGPSTEGGTADFRGADLRSDQHPVDRRRAERRSTDRGAFAPFILIAVASVIGVVLAATVGRSWATIAGCAMPLLAAAWMAMWFDRRWLKPARGLAETAENLAANQWSMRVRPGGAPLLCDTAIAMNVIGDNAGAMLADLAARGADLQTIADAIDDPILLSDQDQRIAVLNAAGAALLKVPVIQALGKRVANVVSDESILRLLDPATTPPGEYEPENVRHHEIRLHRGGQRHTYQAVLKSTRRSGLLLVLHDITQLAGAAQMKTDFVANASHELRTPITAIKIAFETLSDVYREDPEQTTKCVSIIGGHLKRLEEMLGDLLDLSRVEAPDMELKLVVIHIEQLYAGIRAAMEPMARQKLVELALGESDRRPPELFMSDVRLLNLTIKNLVENSIKFTPTGGRVAVDIVTAGAGGGPETGTDIELIVADTGIGIPPEHLERVFERFYQVDAARSGSAGRGTGLGLAIVKHAVHALGGTIDVKSEINVGTTMTCRLPGRTDG